MVFNFPSQTGTLVYIYRWFSMARTPISRSSWSLKVKLQSRFFSLYNKANLLPISRTKPWVPLHKFHCFSLSFSWSPNSRSPIKHEIYTHWAYWYLDNGGRWGEDMKWSIYMYLELWERERGKHWWDYMYGVKETSVSLHMHWYSVKQS